MGDPIAEPLRVIRELFLAAGENVLNASDNFSVETFFSSLLADPITKSQIPSLNTTPIDVIPNNSLVRYRGMVQDMADPEMYIGAYQKVDGTWQTTKYGDYVEEDIRDGPETFVWERRPVYCIKVPGESNWVSPPCVPRPPTPTPQPGSRGKRERDEIIGDADIEMEEAEGGLPLPLAEGSHFKQQCTSRPEGGTAPPARPQHQDDPALRPQEGDCIVFVYDNNDNMKVNEVVEVVGVLSHVPELAVPLLQGGAKGAEADEQEGMDFLPDDFAAPTSLVPRVHAVVVEKEEGWRAGLSLFQKPRVGIPEDLPHCRAQTLSLLTAALGGDALAAEYLLLQLISRVYVRREGTVLGSLSMNLTGCPRIESQGGDAGPPQTSLTGFAVILKEAIQDLCPRCIALPLTTQVLNERRLRPRRDYTRNRLVTGPLQAAPGTPLVLDEIALEAGNLTPLGVDNLQALKGILDSQWVEYDYQYFNLQMPGDMPVIILSASSSLLKPFVDIVLPLAAGQATIGFAGGAGAGAGSLGEGQDFGPLRGYLAQMRQGDFVLETEATSWIEQKLVEARQANRQLGAKEFHTWLTVVRLLALSHGENTVSEVRWKEMMELERRRAERLRASTPAPPPPANVLP